MTDEGSNLKKALENDVRLNCTAHVLNTAMKRVFDQETKKPKNDRSPEAQQLDSCNALVSFIRQSRVQSVSFLIFMDFILLYISFLAIIKSNYTRRRYTVAFENRYGRICSQIMGRNRKYFVGS